MKKQKLIYGKYNYDYYLLRQSRKTVSLIVKPNLVIILKCPLDYGDEKIEKFLKRKSLWIKKQFSYFEKYKNKLTKRKYVSGEIIHPFLGKKHLEKSIEKMKKSHKGQIAWNKDLTKETDDRVRRVSTVLIEGHASGRIKTHPTNKWSNTSIEIAIENELKKVSLKYEKQKHIKGVGFVDFFLPGFDLIIECDGDYWHNLEGRQERDVKRDFGSEFLHQYKTVRFWEHEINESPEKCMRKISKLIKKQGGKI